MVAIAGKSNPLGDCLSRPPVVETVPQLMRGADFVLAIQGANKPQIVRELRVLVLPGYEVAELDPEAIASTLVFNESRSPLKT